MQLIEQCDQRTLQCCHKQLERMDAIILDEVGYVPFSKAGAERLFDVVGRAYERTSLIVTTNLPFEQWTEVLGSERLIRALLDRLPHRVHVLARATGWRAPNAGSKRSKSSEPSTAGGGEPRLASSPACSFHSLLHLGVDEKAENRSLTAGRPRTFRSPYPRAFQPPFTAMRTKIGRRSAWAVDKANGVFIRGWESKNNS